MGEIGEWQVCVTSLSRQEEKTEQIYMNCQLVCLFEHGAGCERSLQKKENDLSFESVKVALSVKISKNLIQENI